MKVQTLLLFGFAAALTSFISTQAVGFTDSFSNPTVDPAWVTDRKEPAAFEVDAGQLRIGIDAADYAAPSSTFSNTQGRQRQANISGNWTVSGELNVTTDLTSGSNQRRTELWTRTGIVGNEASADYPILGLEYMDPSAGASWHVWDPESTGWIDLPNAVNPGINMLSIVGDATSYKYYINGSLAYTDLTGNMFDQLTTVFVEAKNYGQNYDARWDNISAAATPVSTPDLGSTGTLLGLGFASMGFLGRKTALRSQRK